MEFFVAGTRRVVIAGNEILPVGAQANAWSATAVAIAGKSASLNKSGKLNVSAFGSVSAATTITVEVSYNGSTWYVTGSTQVLGAAGDFHITLTTVAPYVRLSSSAAATITGTLVSQ